jgi:hypothetical protein
MEPNGPRAGRPGRPTASGPWVGHRPAAGPPELVPRTKSLSNRRGTSLALLVRHNAKHTPPRHGRAF